MAENPANPYAFPGEDADKYWRGMSLRDYFAGQVLAGAMATATNLGQCSPEERAAAFSQAAEIIFEMADAMLAERAKGDQK